ncbi:MAG: hypothetical protein EBU90_20800 [Proteobacteria bacterium]|nr:hypothetical protein [Pseudomonadota bacterium]NBP15882.1 hypothetical protein [bacterium]
MPCTDVTPITAFQSTNLNSKICSYQRLGDRIMRALGAPLVTVEIHHDQLFENISLAVEMFSKYAGYTEEYIVFDSDLYVDGKGIKLDELFSITPTFNKIVDPQIPTVYIANSSIPATYFSSSSSLSAVYTEGIFKNQILNSTNYGLLTGFNPGISSLFEINGVGRCSNEKFFNSFDYDVMDYRKVIDVVDFEEGSSTGVNSLFTIEQTLAQQTYFSYAMGNYGFDLISWYVLKNWLKDREKLLAIKRYYTFDPRTQYLTFYPPPRTPGSGSRFYGVLACYVERPLKDIIKEQWVYQYALSLCKISVGIVRGKYQGTQLFGGGTINAAIAEDGKAEKEKLESMLLQQGPAGFGDAAPPMFFVG